MGRRRECRRCAAYSRPPPTYSCDSLCMPPTPSQFDQFPAAGYRHTKVERDACALKWQREFGGTTRGQPLVDSTLRQPDLTHKVPDAKVAFHSAIFIFPHDTVTTQNPGHLRGGIVEWEGAEAVSDVAAAVSARTHDFRLYSR